MCDTFVILSDALYFGKNSDREPGEAQLVVRIPPVAGDRKPKVRTTHIEIDQTARRNGLILSKPFWIWGAEMGANDRGVVIGNEAVFTRVVDKTPGLIGMDLLRLGLERGDTAKHALHVITGLLETYGQGGVCGYRDKKFRYDNSFILADPNEAWVLETAGRHWVAKKADGYAAISNCLTIGADYDLKSEGMEDFARASGHFSGNADFSFSDAFDTRLMPYFGASHSRLESSRCRLAALRETMRAGLADAIDILRTHQDPATGPVKGSNADICMHAAGPVIRRSQTCGSMVSRLEKDSQTHLLTGTSAPCLSIFKPVDFNGAHRFYVLNPDEQTVTDSVWHRFESVHRRLLLSGEERREFQTSRDAAEQRVLELLAPAGNAQDGMALIEADRLVRDWSEPWIETYQNRPFDYPFSPYGWYWRHMNRLDAIV